MAADETGKSRGDPEAERRQERLRAALRENLKRRKAQARGRRQPGAAEAGPPHDSAGFVPHKPKR